MYGFPRRAATGGTMCRSSAGWRPSKPAETRSFLGLATSDSPTFAGLTTTGAATFGGLVKAAGSADEQLRIGQGATIDSYGYQIGRQAAAGSNLGFLVFHGPQAGYGGYSFRNADNGDLLRIANDGAATLSCTTASTSTTTGALVVGGGVGVAGAGYFGGVVVVGSAASDPSGANGMIYYDTANNRLRAYVNGAWATVQVA